MDCDYNKWFNCVITPGAPRSRHQRRDKIMSDIKSQTLEEAAANQMQINLLSSQHNTHVSATQHVASSLCCNDTDIVGVLHIKKYLPPGLYICQGERFLIWKPNVKLDKWKMKNDKNFNKTGRRKSPYFAFLYNQNF